MTVLIGIPSFKRPKTLESLLGSIESHVPLGRIHVCVVDNDPHGSAEAVVHSFAHRLPIMYATEPLPGVVHVRNKLVQVAQDYEALIFLDDDESVTSGWFKGIMTAHERYPGDIISGPVRYRLPSDADPRITVGGFFERPEHVDGTVLHITGTGNSLFPQVVLQQLGATPFDAAFAQIGGEDTELFSRLSKQGVKIRWASQAVVVEVVERSEATLNGALRRYRRAGYVRARLELRERQWFMVFCSGLARCAWGVAKVTFSRTRRRVPRASDLATYHAGRGYVAALFGRPLHAYGREGA